MLDMKRSNHHSSFALALLLALLVPIVAACSSTRPPAAATTPAAGGGAATPAPAATAPAAAGTAPAVAATARLAGGALPGTGEANQADLAPPAQQILRVSLDTDPESIDLAQDQDTTAETVLKQLFTGLTRMTPDLKPEGAIAESWQFNADNTQVIFKLKDTTWSDGQPLTAKDFAYAWQRFLDPRTASPYASLMTGVIKGATELNSAAIPTDTAKLPQLLDSLGVKAIDDKTLQVTLEQPAPFFPAITALGTLAPVRKDVVEKFGDKWTEVGNLVGNGPFLLKTWTKGAEMTLAPNANYYEGAPTLTSLVFKIIADDPTTFVNYQTDEIDIASVPVAEVPGVRGNPQFKGQIVEDTQLATDYYGFNATRPPFNDVRVRQAFAYAIDRKTLVDKVLNGVGRRAYSFIPPGLPGHLSEEEAGDAGQKFDPAKARQLLADAGFPDGKGFPEIALSFNNCCSQDLIAQRIQADLQNNLGVKIALDPRESKTFFDDIRRNTPPLWRAAWSSDYPDPYDWDRLVFGPDSDQNFGGWKNDEFTKLLDQADKVKDPDERVKFYKEAEKVLARDAGAIFLYWYGRFRLIKPRVKGLTYTPQDPTIGAYHYKDAQILKH